MDKAKKKRMKRYLTWVFMAAVVLLLTVMPLLAKSEAEADGPQASILSATAEIGSVTESLHGGGTLKDEDAQDAIIPTGVKITEFLVKNGDTVKTGTPVAKVDKVSVMAAITSVNETMDFLQDELEDGRNEKVDASITAVPGGRVKKIFAREGETVQEVMLRDGALAVLSIDSMMAVQFETVSPLATGENVNVTLADGRAISGRVESNLDGKVVITVDDEGYAVGQEVKVEGLGTGILYIHNAWKATGIAGTVTRIHAEEEQTLTAGANLFTLDDREFEGQLQHRANQHREYEELLQTLLKMYRTGTIDAPCDGIVSGVDEDSVHLLAGDGQWEVQLLDGSGEIQYRIVLLGDTSECAHLDGCAGDEHDVRCPLSCTSAVTEHTCPYTGTSHKDNCIEACDPANCSATGAHKEGCITNCIPSAKPENCPNAAYTNHYAECIHSCKGTANADGDCPGNKYHYSTCIESCQSCDEGKDCPATRVHKKDCIEGCSRASIEGICDSEKHYVNCIERCKPASSENETCDATKHKSTCYYYGVTYTAIAAKVFDKGNSALIAFVDPDNTVYSVEKTASGWKVIGGKVNADLLIQGNVQIQAANASQFMKDDIVLVVTGHRGNETLPDQVVLYSRPIPMPDYSDMTGKVDLSSIMGGFSGFGNYAGMADTQETENLHDLEGSTLLTVTPHKTMNLTIKLDEQDISKVSVGMQAKVKVEALKNREFTAEVTKVGIQGTNNSGSSKFEVELRLNVEEDMLPGMSASASISLGTKENVLMVPVVALEEKDGKTFVYTALDKDSGEPGSPVEVVTGVSDGENVEVLSGLQPGDAVYYSYYDTLELDTSAEAERFTFGG